VKKQSAALCTIFLCCAVPFFGQPAAPPEASASGENTGDFELLQNRFGGVTIVSYRGTEKTVVIPETAGGLPVTIIGNKAFYRRDLQSVVIPETVVTIEPLAFAENRLASVTIAGCVSIGYEAFAGNELTAVVLSERLSSIGQRAFMKNRLTALLLPPRITNIGADAFRENPLSSITAGADRNFFASQGFEVSFVNYYVGTGRRAGTYVKNSGVWSLREDPGPGRPE
jgi:hypothetical protein